MRKQRQTGVLVPVFSSIAALGISACHDDHSVIETTVGTDSTTTGASTTTASSITGATSTSGTATGAGSTGFIDPGGVEACSMPGVFGSYSFALPETSSTVDAMVACNYVELLDQQGIDSDRFSGALGDDDLRRFDIWIYRPNNGDPSQWPDTPPHPRRILRPRRRPGYR